MGHHMDKEEKKAALEKLSEEVLNDIKERAKDHKIDCEVARGIAHKHGVSVRSVGNAIDALDIKVKHCGLGCF